MQQEKNSTVLIFFINGINSLLAWSAVLAALSYFADQFKDFNIYSFVPIPLFVAYLLVGITYHITSNRWKYSTIIIVGNTIINLSLAGFFFVSVFLSQTTIGFILMLVCSFTIGLGSNLSQMTYFAMINYLSWQVVSKYTVGTAISSLAMALIRIILTVSFGVNNEDSFKPILIYFLIAIAFNTMDLFMNVYFCRSSVYKEKIDRYLLHHDDQKENNSQVESSSDKKLIQLALGSEKQSQDLTKVSGEYIRQEERIQGQNYFLTLKETGLSIMPYPLIILGVFTVTFILFPGPIFSIQFATISSKWSVLLLNLTFSVGDTVGKYSAQIKGAFNPKSLIYMFFSRFFFFFTVTFIAMKVDAGDVLTDNIPFPFVNLLLCAFTNGFCINASFILAFTVCPLIYKKYAGVLCGLALQVGLILGTVFQIPYAYLIGIA